MISPFSFEIRSLVELLSLTPETTDFNLDVASESSPL